MLVECFGIDIYGYWLEGGWLYVECGGWVLDYLLWLCVGFDFIVLDLVEFVFVIMLCFVLGVMLYGVLVVSVYEVVVYGMNMVGGMLNFGEGGEYFSCYGIIWVSWIK